MELRDLFRTMPKKAVVSSSTATFVVTGTNIEGSVSEL